MNKIICIGTVKEWNTRGTSQVDAPVFCKIELTDARLSITGVVGPRKSGDCYGSCGQINDRELWDRITFSSGWGPDLLSTFVSIWDHYHLNDLQAGSPAQTAHLETIKASFPGYPTSYYDWACSELEKAGLQPDPNYMHNGEPYRYGSAWLFIDVPRSVIAQLEALPEAHITPAWV